MYVQPRGKDCRDHLQVIFELPATSCKTGGCWFVKRIQVKKVFKK